VAFVAHPNVVSADMSVKRERGISDSIKGRRELGTTAVTTWVGAAWGKC